MSKLNKSKPKKQRQLSKPNKLVNEVYATSFPREMKVKLVYFTSLQDSTTTGLAKDYIFNLNSLFDPDYTSSGHQPQSFDQWATYFNRYRVTKAHVQLEAQADIACSVTFLANNSHNAFTAFSQAEETPTAVTHLYSVGGPTIKLDKTFDCAMVNGVNHNVYNTSDRYQALFSSDPSEVIALHVVMSPLSGTGTTVSRTVKITYYATLFDPVQLPLS